MREHIRVADYFLVITGTSRPHVKAMQNELHVRLKAAGEKPITEGAGLGWWVLIDLGDVVVHILQEEARDYYDLDRLYGECPQLDWSAITIGDIPEIPLRSRDLEQAAERADLEREDLERAEVDRASEVLAE